MMGKAMLLRTTCLVSALCFAQAASAQGGADASPAQQLDEAGIQDIVVTARRRDETIQQTPIAMTAITPESLSSKATVNIGDLQGAAPNVLLAPNNAGAATATVSIRGLSFGDNEKSFDLTVGMMLDGVFLGTNTGVYLDFFDIQSIEVLRGPQGTLFGRNTIGGVINIRRTRPTGEWGVKAEATYGNYDHFTGRVVVNAPIVKDVLALKLFEFHDKTDGFYRNFYTGQRVGRSRNDNFGGSLLFTPSSNFDALLTVERQVQKYRTVQSNISKTGELFCDFAPAVECNRLSNDDYYRVTSDELPGRYTSNGQTLEMNLDLGFTKLTSITGLRNSYETQLQDFDGFSPVLYHTDRIQNFRQFSQELRASGDLSPTFDYVVGGYYYKSRYDLLQTTNLFGSVDPNATQFTIGRAKSTAVFADFNWGFAENLRLSFGGRYTHDVKGNQLRYGAAQYPSVSAGFSKFTPKVGVDYRPNSDLMVYASWSRGFRSGGFSGRGLTLFSSTTPYGPETVDSYEAGFKSTLLDRKLFFNMTGFLADYSNLQQNTTIPTVGGQGNETIVTNVGSARIYGVEADLTAQPTSALKITAAVGLLNAKFKDFISQGAISPSLPDVRTIDYSAVDMPYAPKFTGSFTASYEVPLSFGTLTLNGGYRYVSRYDQQIALDPAATYPATGVVVVQNNDSRVRTNAWSIADASATLAFELASGAQAKLTGFVRNLTDNRGPGRAFTVAGLWSFAQAREPRTYGVTLGVEF